MMDLIEKDIANEIVNIGLGKAADSMAFFTKEKVLIRGLEVQRLNFNDVDKIASCGSDHLNYILTTEIQGELSGNCYLIFSEEEVQNLLKVSLPESILNDEDKLRVMGDAILLEMDNIIVASVVTQFSNFFNYKMYGDVPRLTKSYCSELKQLIVSENVGKDYFMYFKSEMITEDLNVCPDFLWILNDKYFEGVKAVANNDEVLKKIKAQSK